MNKIDFSPNNRELKDGLQSPDRRKILKALLGVGATLAVLPVTANVADAVKTIYGADGFPESFVPENPNEELLIALFKQASHGKYGKPDFKKAKKLLKRKDIDIDYVDDGCTYLVRAAYFAEVEIVEWLLKNGARKQIDKALRRAKLAKRLGRQNSDKIIELLEQYGAKE